MSDADSLLAAVLEKPEDDNLRLRYADCLEENREHGRARLIRLMCRWASGESVEDRGRGYQSAATTARFLARTTVLRDLPGKPLTVLGNAFTVTGVGDGWTAHVTRGFVDTLTCSAPLWLAHAPAVLARHPVRSVTLTTTIEGIWWADGVAQVQAGETVLKKAVSLGALDIEATKHHGHHSPVRMAYLSVFWPRVAFTLPAVSRQATLEAAADGFAGSCRWVDLCRHANLPPVLG